MNNAKIPKTAIARAKRLYKKGVFGFKRLSKRLGIPITTLRYHLDAQYRAAHDARTAKWRAANPKKVRQIRRRAALRFHNKLTRTEA